MSFLVTDDPVPVSRGGGGINRKNRPKPSTDPPNVEDSLFSLCQQVIVKNLELYPPECFGLLPEEDWVQLVQLRHDKTSPKEGSGGLDGTGRIAPAVSDRYMSVVEECNVHLAESERTDQLIWRDCVEFRFRRGGLTRPKALTIPWPLLVKKIQNRTDVLTDLMNQDASKRDEQTLRETVDDLVQAPMNVALLKATGVGKTVKKIVKAHKTHLDETVQRLEVLLTSWKELAASSGVKMGPGAATTTAAKTSSTRKNEQEDLDLLESCQTWRQLYAVLKYREDQRRSNQGRRMRQIRQNLSKDRPKIVKVRPSSAKQEHILARNMEKNASSSGAPGNGKMVKLRKEAGLMSSRQRQTTAPVKSSSSSSSSFGAAVAFASGSAAKKNSNAHRRRKGLDVVLAGGKRMKLPTNNLKQKSRRK